MNKRNAAVALAAAMLVIASKAPMKMQYAGAEEAETLLTAITSRQARREPILLQSASRSASSRRRLKNLRRLLRTRSRSSRANLRRRKNPWRQKHLRRRKPP